MNFNEIWIKTQTLSSSRKFIWKCSLQNDSHFTLARGQWKTFQWILNLVTSYPANVYGKLIHFQYLNKLCTKGTMINSLWPSDCTWQCRYGSTFIQVMACCLFCVKPSLEWKWTFSEIWIKLQIFRHDLPHQVEMLDIRTSFQSFCQSISGDQPRVCNIQLHYIVTVAHHTSQNIIIDLELTMKVNGSPQVWILWKDIPILADQTGTMQ